MNKALCLMGLILSTGCTTALVRPYVGVQQNWPVASGSIVNTRFDLPIFTSLPPAPYDILAELRIKSPLYAQPEEGHMPVLVKKAKQLGADALMFVQGQIFFAANYGPRDGAEVEGGGKRPTLTQVNRFNPDSFRQGVTIVAIRWLGDPPPGLPKRSVAPTFEQEAVEPPVPEMEPEMMPETPAEELPVEPIPPAEPAEPETSKIEPALEAEPATEEMPAPEAAPEEEPQPPAEPEPVPAPEAEEEMSERPPPPPVEAFFD